MYLLLCKYETFPTYYHTFLSLIDILGRDGLFILWLCAFPSSEPFAQIILRRMECHIT